MNWHDQEASDLLAFLSLVLFIGTIMVVLI